MLSAYSPLQGTSTWRRRPISTHRIGWSSYEMQHVWMSTRKRLLSQAQVELRARIKGSRGAGTSVPHQDLQATTEAAGTAVRTLRHSGQAHTLCPNNGTRLLRPRVPDDLPKSIIPAQKVMDHTAISATRLVPLRRSVPSVPYRFLIRTADLQQALLNSTRLPLARIYTLFTDPHLSVP